MLLETPLDRTWREIWYHPQPVITRIQGEHELNYWQKEVPGCKIELIKEDLGFMKNLVRGIKVKITYPEDHQEMYVEPLAQIHKRFFDLLGEIIWTVYPYPKNRRSWQQKRHWELGGKIHSEIAYFYWQQDYRIHTPETWVELLNSWLQTIETFSIKEEAKIDTLMYYITTWTRDYINFIGEK